MVNLADTKQKYSEACRPIIKDGTIVREVSMAELKSESPSGLEDYFMDIMTGRKENENTI